MNGRDQTNQNGRIGQLADEEGDDGDKRGEPHGKAEETAIEHIDGDVMVQMSAVKFLVVCRWHSGEFTIFQKICYPNGGEIMILSDLRTFLFSDNLGIMRFIESVAIFGFFEDKSKAEKYSK